MDKNIKIRHIRDAYNYKRVMTLVTRINEDGTVTYAYAINTPTRYVTLASKTITMHRKVPGDAFSRARGRQIAMARLEKAGVTIKPQEGMHTFEAVLRELRNSRNSIVRKISTVTLQSFLYDQEYRRSWQEYNESGQDFSQAAE